MNFWIVKYLLKTQSVLNAHSEFWETIVVFNSEVVQDSVEI